MTWQTIGVGLCGGIMAIGESGTMQRPSTMAMLLLRVVSGAAHLMITRALKMRPPRR